MLYAINSLSSTSPWLTHSHRARIHVMEEIDDCAGPKSLAGVALLLSKAPKAL